VDVGEAHVAGGEAEGALGVVDAEKVEHGGVEVVDLNFVFDGLVAKVVGRAVSDPWLDAAPGEPGGEAEGIVVASISALGEGSAPKFTGPDDEGIVEKAKLFQVSDEGRDGLIDCFTVLAVSADEAVVLIPAVAISAGTGELDEADATLNEAAGKEALAAKDFGLIEIGIEAIHFFHGVGLAGEVEEIGDGGLHPEGGFVIQNGGFDLLFSGETGFRSGIELPHEVELPSLESGVRLGGIDIGDGGVSGVEDRALIGGRKVTGVEVVEATGRDEASVEDDESREILVLGAEAIADPSAHTRATLETGTGVEEVVRGGVFREL